MKTQVAEWVHRKLSVSRSLVWLAAKLRNQTNSVIGLYLGQSPHSNCNGEFAVLDQIAPHCSSFVDVGANVGGWSEYFLRQSSARGTLYEPGTAAYKTLMQKWRCDNRVRVLNLAVGAAPGRALFIEEENCGQTSSLAETHEPTDIEPREVAICTLDDEFKERGEIIDYVKIDTEGYDFKVMLGAKKLLESSHIRFLQFEYNANWLACGSSLKQARDFLNGLGYSVLLIRSTGLHELNYDFWGDYFRYSNFLAFRPADIELVRPLIRKRL